MATTAELFEVGPGGSSGSGRPEVLAARRAGGAAGVRPRPGGSPRRKGVREKGRVAAPVSARAEREVGEGWLGDWGGEAGKGTPSPRGEGAVVSSGLGGLGVGRWTWAEWCGKGGLRRGKRSHEPQVRRALTCRLGTRVIFSGPPDIGMFGGFWLLSNHSVSKGEK